MHPSRLGDPCCLSDRRSVVNRLASVSAGTSLTFATPRESTTSTPLPKRSAHSVLFFSNSSLCEAGTLPFAMAAFFLFLMPITALMTMLSASDAAWCVCRSDMSSNVLQKTLDYACGAGADCSPIVQNGACYNPNTVLAHCSYAVNSYYQKKGQAQGACDFAGSATLSSTDPGSNSCTYPASSSSAGSSSVPTTTPTTSPPTSTTPVGTTPTSTTPVGTTPSPPTYQLTPPTFNPNTGTGTGTGTGGVLGGLGPSGTTSSFDSSGGAMLRPSPNVAFFFITLFFSSLFLVRI